jgi:penicillin-binding protein 1C
MIICSPVFLLIVLLFWWFSVPSPLFQDSTSTVLTDLDGRLLGARIAADHQWRFPEIGEVPEKFADAITTFEDRWFFLHPGVNPVSLGRALSLNIRAGKIVSGGSTITMQVIRLARKNKPRTYPEKVKEILMAFRLETSHTKGEILALYASHAPFGGNVVGLEAASWRYFGVSPSRLTWAQAATLAILPNCPGLIYPGRNPGQLLRKRDRLLEMMRDRGIIDQETCELAKLEPLPGKPFILPASAPHLLDRCISAGYMGKKIRSTVVYGLQEDVMEIIGRHSVYLSANRIYNVAAVVLDVNSGQTLAYAGNLPGIGGDAHANAVDIIISPRSTGSLLKPLLYAAMLDDGSILPTTLVPDIPTQIGGFIPENYNLTYDGAVPAKNALARSLNIPAVKMLQSYDYSRFYGLLRFLGMTTLRKPADHYGLSLILGGAEATLWDVASIYASMARKLNQYAPSPSFRDEPELYSTGLRAQGIAPWI